MIARVAQRPWAALLDGRARTADVRCRRRSDRCVRIPAAFVSAAVSEEKDEEKRYSRCMTNSMIKSSRGDVGPQYRPIYHPPPPDFRRYHGVSRHTLRRASRAA